MPAIEQRTDSSPRDWLRHSACSASRPSTLSMQLNAAFCSGTSCASAAMHIASISQTAPHVLDFDVELVLDGRTFRAAGQLRARPRHSAARHRRSTRRGAVRDHRPARRPRPRHRRLQVRQRNRRRAQGRPSVLFHRVLARADARPDHRGHRARRSDLPRKGHRACIPRPTASPASSAIARPAGR